MASSRLIITHDIFIIWFKSVFGSSRWFPRLISIFEYSKKGLFINTNLIGWIIHFFTFYNIFNKWAIKSCIGGCSTRIDFTLTFLLFLIYTEKFSQRLHNDIKLFAADTSLSSVVDITGNSVLKLNVNVISRQDWAYKWKMTFNSDTAKLAQKLHSLKRLKILFTLIPTMTNCHC